MSGRLFQTRGADELKPRCDKTVLEGLFCKSMMTSEVNELVCSGLAGREDMSVDKGNVS